MIDVGPLPDRVSVADLAAVAAPLQERLRLDYTHHFDGGDLEALLALSTDDAVCDFGPFGIWEGKEALRSGWAPYFGSTSAIGSSAGGS